MNSKSSAYKSANFDQLASELVHCGRFFAERGWSPATSSNYSAKIDQDNLAITRTGVDKYNMNSDDVIVVNRAGEVVAPTGERSSAETLIHTAIYNQRPKVESILHTHSPENTRLSLHFLSAGEIQFEGYEMQKGFEGNATHEVKTVIPVLPNSQDMKAYSKDVEAMLRKYPNAPAFLMAGHGVYTWASSVPAAKRQIETLEFLFRCLIIEMAGV